MPLPPQIMKRSNQTDEALLFQQVNRLIKHYVSGFREAGRMGLSEILDFFPVFCTQFKGLKCQPYFPICGCEPRRVSRNSRKSSRNS